MHAFNASATRRKTALAATAGAVLALALFAAPASAQQQRVLLCHFDVGGEPGHLIEVSGPAVDAHIGNHGDYRVESGNVGDPCPQQGIASQNLADTGLEAPLLALLGVVLGAGGMLLRRRPARP